MPLLGWAVRDATWCCGVIFNNDVNYTKGTRQVGLPTHAVNVDVGWASLGEGDETGREGVREGMETDL